MTKTEIKVNEGTISVNSANVLFENPTTALIEVKLNSSYVTIVASSDFSERSVCPSILFTDNKFTQNLLKNTNKYTKITFSEFEAFDVWSAESYRDTIRVCLRY